MGPGRRMTRFRKQLEMEENMDDSECDQNSVSEDEDSSESKQNEQSSQENDYLQRKVTGNQSKQAKKYSEKDNDSLSVLPVPPKSEIEESIENNSKRKEKLEDQKEGKIS